mgnify:CR=1 FL=1
MRLPLDSACRHIIGSLQEFGGGGKADDDITLVIINRLGTSRRRIMLSFMIATALLADFVITPIVISALRLVTLWDLARIRMGTDPGLEIPLFHGL